MASNIIPDLQPFAISLSNLSTLPGNPRKGDVQAVARSLKRFGQHRPLVAKLVDPTKPDEKYGVVIAGNHTFLAARELGWDEIAVVWVDDDSETAMARALADNRTHDLGSYDDNLLHDALERLKDNEDLLTATGYGFPDLMALAATVTPVRLEPGQEQQEGGGNPQRAPGNPVVSYQIVFDDEDQQQVWFKFIRWLKRTSDGDTVAGRLTNFLGGILEGYDE